MAIRDGFVRLWLDDIRPAPKGWYWATSAEEAWDVLQGCYVTEASLDHDLGDVTKWTGYDLVLALARYKEEYGLNYWPLSKPQVHSANPVGRANMQAVIDRYAPQGYPLINEREEK
jgi:hypothetical protein